MALSNIDIETVGDYVWSEDFQNYHETKKEDFKYYFKDWLEKLLRIPKTVCVNINVKYFPVTSKFDITYISTREKDILQALRDDPEFSNKYFTKI